MHHDLAIIRHLPDMLHKDGRHRIRSPDTPISWKQGPVIGLPVFTLTGLHGLLGGGQRFPDKGDQADGTGRFEASMGVGDKAYMRDGMAQV